MVRLLIGLLAGLSIVGCASRDGDVASAQETRGAAARNSRPNVILIVADDLGYADVGFQQRSRDVKTPNIDSIAANGVRFTSGYVTCPVCAPTRAALLTGRYQQRFGFEQNPSPQTPENFGLPVDQVTLANVLKDAGYATGMVGKWHLGFEEQHHPMSRGFDSYYGFLSGAHDYFNPGEGPRNALLRGREVVQLEGYLTDVFAREAAAFVDQHAPTDTPFFLYLAFNAVHTPMQVPQNYLDRFPNAPDEKRRQLLAMLSAMDDGIGKVLERVRAAGEEDNTVIVFLSDNGGPTQGNASRNEPFSGFKNGTREGGVRVPFAMQWKGKLPAGNTYDKAMSSLDVFPTVLAATGATAPKDQSLDGVDLAPYVSGKNDAAPHETLYWRYGEKWAIRNGDMKLVRTEAGPGKLYDLSKDPAEANDLAMSMPDVRKKLRAKFDAWSKEMKEPLWRDRREKPLEGPSQGKRGASTQQNVGDAQRAE